MLPNKLCGIGGGIGVFFLTLGLLISSLCQNIWNYDVLVEYWRWLVIYPMMIELMRVIAFPFLFKTETPPFIFNKILSESKVKKTFKQAPSINKNELIRENQTQETIMIRENVPKPTQGYTEIDQDVHAEAYRQIKRVKGYIYPADRVDFETTDTLSYMEGRAAHGKANVGIRRLFGRRHRRQFLAGCFLGLSHELCGGAFFFVYSTVLFDQISGNGKLITLIIATVNIVVALGSIFSVAYIGRKPNLVIGLLIQGVALLILLIGYKTFNVGTVMVSAILFVLGFCLGIGGAQLIYLGEILPPKGVGIAFGIQSASYAILGLVIPLLVSAIGPMPLIIFFMIFCFSATVICQVYIIETRNKSAKEIFDEFNASLTHLCSRSKNLKIELK